MSDNERIAGLENDQHSRLESKVFEVRGLLQGLSSQNVNAWELSIEYLEIPVTDMHYTHHQPTILIGAVIKGDRDKILYESATLSVTFSTETAANNLYTGDSVSCCYGKLGNKKRIVRHFHFDFQPGVERIVPSHVQFGGKFNQQGHVGDCHYCLEHFLEPPRIPIPPVDYIMLIDLAIREFETDLRAIADDRNWRAIVEDSNAIWSNR